MGCLALVVACGLVEGGQIFIEGRMLSPYDFSLNLAGGGIGLWAGLRTGRSASTVRALARPTFGAFLAVAYAGIIALLAARIPAARAGLLVMVSTYFEHYSHGFANASLQ